MTFCKNFFVKGPSLFAKKTVLTRKKELYFKLLYINPFIFNYIASWVVSSSLPSLSFSLTISKLPTETS